MARKKAKSEAPKKIKPISLNILEIAKRLQNLEQTSGGGGTSDYTDLTNKPQINGVELSGNKSTSDLNIANTFQGTIAEWNQLTTVEKKAYDHASIPDSLDGNVTFPASKTMLNDGRSVEDLTKHGYSTYSSITSYTDASNPFVVPDDGYVRLTSCSLRIGDPNTNIGLVTSGSSNVTEAIYVRKNTKVYITDVVSGSLALYIPLS